MSQRPTGTSGLRCRGLTVWSDFGVPVAGLGGSLLLVAALPEGQCLATGVAGCSRWGTGKGLGVHSQRLWQELHLHLALTLGQGFACTSFVSEAWFFACAWLCRGTRLSTWAGFGI